MLGLLAQTQGKGAYLQFEQDSTTSADAGYLPYVLGGLGFLIVLLVIANILRNRKQPSSSVRRPSVAARKRKRQKMKDILEEFSIATVDMDALLDPPEGKDRPIPNELEHGTILLSQRLGVKCLLLEDLHDVDPNSLKEVCARKLRPNQAVYLPMGTHVYRDEILQQGQGIGVKLRKGTIFLSVNGHPTSYLIDDVRAPLRKEINSYFQILPITESTAQRYLQHLVDIPASFELFKEDVLFDTSQKNQRVVPKGSLIMSRSGALVGLMLEDYQLPHNGPLSDLEALFQLRTNYERYALETLIQQSAKAGGKAVPIEKGTFIFSSAGKVYFVWRDDFTADEATLKTWSRQSQINHECIIEVSKTRSNSLGGPGHVITQDELNYLREVFRQAGTTNINRETLILDSKVFYKFVQEIPYAHTGKFRGYIGKGGVVMLNTTGSGTFSVELGGKDIEITDQDLQMVRKHLVPDGKLLIKIGTDLRIKDERDGDWIYRATTNLFYPYETLTRPYMEEFIPESIRYDRREPKLSTVIGPNDNPKEGDYGATGEPIGDLIAVINNSLFPPPGSPREARTVFLLDGTPFHFKDRLYRVNEDMVFRPHEYRDKLQTADFEAYAHDWKINPVVEDVEEEEVPAYFDDETDLEDLPYDTDTVR